LHFRTWKLFVRRVLALVFSVSALMDGGFGHDLASDVVIVKMLYHLSRIGVAFEECIVTDEIPSKSQLCAGHDGE